MASCRWELLLFPSLFASAWSQDLFLEMKSVPAKAPNVARSAGILYELWHGKAADSMAKVAAQGGPQLTTETVIRSDGKLTLDNVYKLNPRNNKSYTGLTSLDIYNVQPELGFYCLYRTRGNETPAWPKISECANISGVARRHAELLSGAGFDYVAIDLTNWPVWNPDSDVTVFRPLEVLFDEWSALRAAGIKTPYIAAWLVNEYHPGMTPSWQWVLENIYNNPERRKLVWQRHDNGGKLSWFVTDNSHYNSTTVALIEDNFGQKNVEVIKMWALFGKSKYDEGSWGFFSPCTTPSGSFTTSMVGDASVLGDCNQFQTKGQNNMVIEVSASGGYMLSQCAIPWAAPGHMRGLTLQRLFKSVLETGAPNLFMSSFNEHIGGRQAPAQKGPTAFNMGLPNDPQRDNVWVDTYGAEYSRDIEPTVEGGSRVWDVAASCVQAYKAKLTCNDPSLKSSPCCSTEDKFIWNNVWSLQTGSDRVLTTNSQERAKLTGQGWQEVCAATVGASVFCHGGSDGRDGPFMMYNTVSAVNGAKALYRCIEASAGGRHFFSLDPGCERQKVESVLGYLSPTRGGETLRALRRCVSPQGWHTHALDIACAAGTSQEGPVLGFVK